MCNNVVVESYCGMYLTSTLHDEQRPTLSNCRKAFMFFIHQNQPFSFYLKHTKELMKNHHRQHNFQNDHKQTI